MIEAVRRWRREAESEKSATQSKASSSNAETTTAQHPSGTLYTAVAHAARVTAKEGLTDCFYVDSGASDHLIPSKGDLRAYIEFEQPAEIAATNRGKIYDDGN